jgi:two-component system sensor histidine kinase MprB
VSLRIRLTLIVAAIVAVAVVASAYAAQYATRHQLRVATDRFLVDRAARYPGVATGEIPGFKAGDDDGPPSLPRGTSLDAVTQVIDRNGTVQWCAPCDPVLPVAASDVHIANRRSDARLRDVRVEGEHYRMITAPGVSGGAVQIARSLHETDDILDVLRHRFVVIALTGTLFAAVAGWLVGRRTTRPIERLTHASEQVATTQDLSVPVPVQGNDEVARLARSFNTMLAALATSREQQKRLVVDASHELRTPLTAIRTNIDLLRRAESMDPEQRRQLVAETGLELDELTNLVTELVDLATDVRFDEPVTSVDLEEIAEGVVTRYRRRSGRAIELAVTDAARVDGRRAMLDRALSNLVDNALKFSEPDTAVEVAVRGSHIEVLDRGTGVAAGDEDRVFDRFFRAAEARTKPGSGLGLAIVRQVAEVHGGRAALAARPGGGTVAVLDLADAGEDDRPGSAGSPVATAVET